MTNIKQSISKEVIRKMLGNKKNAIKFIIQSTEDDSPSLQRLLSRKSSTEIYKEIEKIWNYDKATPIIRSLFTQSRKYKNGKTADTLLEILKKEWEKLNLGKIEWPFSQGKFDEFVQRVNSELIDRLEKDEKVRQASTRYRRIKEINTIRNDYIETLIFEKNKKVIPTLTNSKGVDFYIDGIAYDQKVAKSVTAEFKRDYGKEWKNIAKINPDKVAEYLYTYQDEGRFGADPRIYIVYLDENINVENIRKAINKIDLNHPMKITFTYTHSSTEPRVYTTECFVILLDNDK